MSLSLSLSFEVQYFENCKKGSQDLFFFFFFFQSPTGDSDDRIIILNARVLCFVNIIIGLLLGVDFFHFTSNNVPLLWEVGVA